MKSSFRVRLNQAPQLACQAPIKPRGRLAEELLRADALEIRGGRRRRTTGKQQRLFLLS
jgi:hypothetical protein